MKNEREKIIIKRIIYDVEVAKERYEELGDATCVAECREELEFLRQLLSNY